jgi:hypothetical protein
VLLSNSTLESYGLTGSEPVYHLHCAISNQTDTIIEVQQEEEELTGFDRLREIGFSEEDVREARRFFYGVRRRELRGDETRNELVQLEEEFLRSVPEGTAAAQPSGPPQALEESFYDLLGGMLIGFLLGLMTLIILFEDARVSGTRKCGIYVGIGCNLSFCLMKLIVL